MITVVLLTILIFAVAMLGLAVGVIFKKRGLRGPCCGRRHATGQHCDCSET